MRIIIESDQLAAQPTLSTNTATLSGARAAAKNGGAAPTRSLTTSQGRKLAAIAGGAAVGVTMANTRDAGSALGPPASTRQNARSRDGGAAPEK
jgi:hypothetical protein